jgi:hypothetical protein
MRCFTPQYFNSNSQFGVKMNFIPVTGTTATGYEFEVFNGFQVIGVYAKSGAIPNGSPGSVTLAFRGNNIQSGFPYQELAQSMFVANRDGANQSGDMTYAPASNGLDFSKYFKRNMQDEDGLQSQNLMALLAAPFMIAKFWEDWEAMQLAAGQIDFARTEHVFNLIQKIFTSTDLRLWQAPGIYTIAGNPPNADPYFGQFDATFGGASIGDDGLIVAEIKSIE